MTAKPKSFWIMSFVLIFMLAILWLSVAAFTSGFIIGSDIAAAENERN
jgi:hypothetical protein